MGLGSNQLGVLRIRAGSSDRRGGRRHREIRRGAGGASPRGARSDERAIRDAREQLARERSAKERPSARQGCASTAKTQGAAAKEAREQLAASGARGDGAADRPGDARAAGRARPRRASVAAERSRREAAQRAEQEERARQPAGPGKDAERAKQARKSGKREGRQRSPGTAAKRQETARARRRRRGPLSTVVSPRLRISESCFVLDVAAPRGIQSRLLDTPTFGLLVSVISAAVSPQLFKPATSGRRDPSTRNLFAFLESSDGNRNMRASDFNDSFDLKPPDRIDSIRKSLDPHVLQLGKVRGDAERKAHIERLSELYAWLDQNLIRFGKELPDPFSAYWPSTPDITAFFGPAPPGSKITQCSAPIQISHPMKYRS